MFRHIRDRADLITLVAKEALAPACRRACTTGKVEVLGGFGAIPPSLLPGWILQITAKHGTVFLIAVVPDATRLRYRVRSVEEVPWHLWVGTPIRSETYTIYQGDWPAKYDAKRELARERLKYDPERNTLLGVL